MRRVIAAVDELFFAAKIRTTAELLGIEIAFVRDDESLREAVRDALSADVSPLVILDLQATRFDPFAAAEVLKADSETKGASIVSFFSHVNVELMRRAKEAGIDKTLPRSAFTKQLPEILSGRKTEATDNESKL